MAGGGLLPAENPDIPTQSGWTDPARYGRLRVLQKSCCWRRLMPDGILAAHTLEKCRNIAASSPQHNTLVLLDQRKTGWRFRCPSARTGLCAPWRYGTGSVPAASGPGLGLGMPAVHIMPAKAERGGSPLSCSRDQQQLIWGNLAFIGQLIDRQNALPGRP